MGSRRHVSYMRFDGKTPHHVMDEILSNCFSGMVELYNLTFPPRNVVHNAGFTGEGIVRNMLTGHWRVYYESCQMMPHSFVNLCTILRERGLRRDS